MSEAAGDGYVAYVLAHELSEAKSEIRRHHEDFEAIRKALDSWDYAVECYGKIGLVPTNINAIELARKIRKVVG